MKWWPLKAGTINKVPSGTARFIREAVTVLKDNDRMEAAAAEYLLAKTG